MHEHLSPWIHRYALRYIPYTGAPVGLQGHTVNDVCCYLRDNILGCHPDILSIGIEYCPGVVTPAALLWKPYSAREANIRT